MSFRYGLPLVSSGMIRLHNVIAAAVFALAISTLPAAADWPQWRGPNRDGSCAGPKWPQSFSGLKEKWRLPLGASYSGPVTDGKLVFTTESKD